MLVFIGGQYFFAHSYARIFIREANLGSVAHEIEQNYVLFVLLDLRFDQFELFMH